MQNISHNSQVLISKEQIQEQVIKLGAKISQNYQGQHIIAVVVLKGGIVFASDLIRQLSCEVTVETIEVASYIGKESSQLTLVRDLNLDLKNCHVLIIEDIVDTGKTIDFLFNHLQSKSPASIEVAALIAKPKVSNKIAYAAFVREVPFIIGYGMDFNGKFRNLPDILTLDDEIVS